MSKLYYSETIVGSANSTVYGNGLTSTEAEPKVLQNVIITVNSKQGNFVEGWIEREKQLEIIDYNLPLSTDTYRITLPIEIDIPIGKTWKVALRSGGAASTIYVTYEYELR